MCKITKRLLLWVLMMVPILAMSQIPITQYVMETGVDASKWKTLPEDAAVTKTLLTNAGDSRASAVVDMGFNFVFGGTTYTQFSTNTDGNLRLGPVVTSTRNYSSPFGTSLSSNLPKINGFGSDGRMVSGGYVKYATLGTAPNRTLVVEFKTAIAGSSVSDIKWQVQLSETTNEVMFVYGPETPVRCPIEFQLGMAASVLDVITINTVDNTMSIGSTSEEQSVWPSPNRYFRFHIPSCLKPVNMVTTSMTSRSASFRWSKGQSDQSSWQYTCVRDTVSPNWTNATETSDTTCSIASLLPNTDYVLYVRTNCGASDYSVPFAYPFHTECESLPTPYMEDFESYENGDFPNCWASVMGTSSVFTNTEWMQNAASGVNSLVVGSGDTLVLPKVKLAANEIMLVIKALGQRSSGTLELGYVTDLSTMNFVAMDSIVPEAESYVERIVDYRSLTALDSIYIAIKHVPSQSTWSKFYIDDIQIVKTTTCTRLGYAYIANATNNSIEVEWEANEYVAYHEVAYGLTKHVGDAAIESIVGESSCVISNVMEDTTYYVWVRNICDTDTSLWLPAGSVRTKHSCAEVMDVMVSSESNTTAALGWTIDDSYGDEATAVEISWKISTDAEWSEPVTVEGQNYYYMQGLEGGYTYDVRLRTRCTEDSANYVYTQLTTLPCGHSTPEGAAKTYYMPFGGSYKYSYSQMLYPASALTNVDTIKGISFYVTETENTMDRMVDVYIANTTIPLLSTSIRVLESTMTKVATNVEVSPTQLGWITIMFATPFVYDGTSNLAITVDDNTNNRHKKIYVKYNDAIGSSLYKQTSSSDINPLASRISSMRYKNGAPMINFISTCEVPACVAPIVAIGDITDNSISVSWHASSEQAIVSYKLSSDTSWTTESVTDSSYTFSDLQFASLYEIRIGGICGGDTLYTDLEVLTDCKIYDLPLIETFDDSELPCWTIGQMPGTRGKLKWKNDSIMEFDYTKGGYLVTPKLGLEVSHLQLSFLAGASHTYQDGSLVVIACSDPDNMNTYVPLDTFYLSKDAPISQHFVSCNSYSGHGKYLMFTTLTGSTILDSIAIDVIPECNMPTDLAISEISSTSAKLTWVDEGLFVEKWLVACTKVGEDSASVVEVPVENGSSYLFANLEPNTEYSVMVTTICSMGDSVDAFEPVTFRTNCAPSTLPYWQDFEEVAIGEMDPCWYRESSFLVTNPMNGLYIHVPGVDNSNYVGQNVALSANKSITSPLIAAPLNTLSINFDMMIQDTTYAGSLAVGYTTSPNDMSTFVAVDTIGCDTSTWNNYTVDFNNIATTDTGYVVFKNVDNVAEDLNWILSYYFIWLDNINISTYSSCVRPLGINVNDVAETSASVSILDSVNTNNYTIAWNTVSDVNTASTLDVTAPTAQITNLQPSTTYYIWVRSNCGSEHSSWVKGDAFETDCAPLTIPYSENFDSYTYGIGQLIDAPEEFPNHDLPNCWEINGMDVLHQSPRAVIIDEVGYFVTGNAYAMMTSGSSPIYSILPAFNVPTDSLMISFTYVNDKITASEGEFVLGIMTNNGDPSTFVPLHDYPLTRQMSREEYIFGLDSNVLPNTNYYIVFRCGGVGNYSTVTAIDDVVVDYMPSCFPPYNFKVNGITSSTLDLGWEGNSSSYELRYRTPHSSTWTSQNVASNAASLSNLQSDSIYWIQVRGICSENDMSEWSKTFEISMPCAPSLIPWSEDFESYKRGSARGSSRPYNYPNHVMPECWFFGPMTSSDQGGPAMWMTSQTNSTWAHYNTIDGVSLKMVGNSEKPTYAVLPLMDAPIDTLVLYFDYAMQSNATAPQVGVMTNPYDFSTFIALESYPIYDSAHAAEHYFCTDNLDSNQTYYITLVSGNYGVGTVIDNLRVEYIPSCVKPMNVETTLVMDTFAQLSWETSAANSEVKYHAVGDSTWSTVNASGDTVTLTGLQNHTEYEVYVRAICSASDTSIWSDMLTFKTPCTPAALPLYEEFSTYLSALTCWDFYQGLVDNVMDGTDPLVSVTDRQSKWSRKSATDALVGAHAYVDVYGKSLCDWMTTPILTIEPGAVLSFDIAFTKYGDTIAATDFEDDKFYVLASTDNGASWNKLITWGADSTNTYPLDSISTTGDSIAVELDQYVNQNIRIAFYVESTVFGGDNNLHLDNVLVEVPASYCPVPTDVAVNAEAVSATLTWQGEDENYEVAIRESGADWTDTISVTGLTYTFTSLMPDITYDYRLRHACSDEYHSEWIGGSFTTLELQCEKPVVVVSTVTNESATFTWIEGENHTEWEVNVFNEDVNQIFNATEASYVVYDLENATEYQVAVRAKCAENVYSDWSDTVSFSTLDCLPITSVAISEITENSAKVSWNASGEESDWQINYGTQGFTQGEGEMINTTTSNYTLTGLEAETAYDVYVRAMCSDDFYSLWSDVVTFTTLESHEGIDGVEGNFQFTIYPNPTSNATTISLNGVEGKVVISVVDMNGRTVANEAIECGVDCEKRIDVSGLSQGTYFVRVLGDNINSVRKLIVR